MNRSALARSLVVWLALAAIGQSQEVPHMPKPQKEHDWLKQLAGEWESESELTEPGQPAHENQRQGNVRG